MKSNENKQTKSSAADYGQNVVPRVELKQLLRKSDWRGGRQLSLHLVFICATAALVNYTQNSWLIWSAMLIHGCGLVFLFAPLHETIHRTAFQQRKVNDVVAFGIGLVLFLGANHFRRFHFDHHRYTQDPRRDPELAGKNVSSMANYLLYLSGILFWKGAFTTLINCALGKADSSYITAVSKTGIIKEARILLLVYGVLFLSGIVDQRALLIYWLIPMVLAQPFWRGWLLAEHTGCEQSSDMYANTRTTFTNPLTQFFLWNMPFHVEHHAYPAVPFYQLPALHKLIKTRILYSEPGYLSFHRRQAAQLKNSS
ncbi:MAG: fatty acid desaturase [Parasphingorhabdus sp.]|jgi:fatty acid desaturase